MGWFRRASRKPGHEDSMDREIAFHIAELTQANIEKGISPDEARRRAVLEFGGREQVKQKMREVHISALVESLAFNLKAALRFLRKSPSFSFIVILRWRLASAPTARCFLRLTRSFCAPYHFRMATSWLRFISTTSKAATRTDSLRPAAWKTGTG